MQDKSLSPVLEMTAVSAAYADTDILRHVTLSAAIGEIVAIVGHNAAGKSTLLKSIIGAVPRVTGEINIDGRAASRRPWEMRRRGVVYCAQGQRVFGTLTVNENLRFACATAGVAFTKKDFERVRELFPEISRYAHTKTARLSGGERQMVSLAMTLITPARIVMFDEPTVGLSRPVADRLWDHITSEQYRQEHAVLVVEHELQTVIDRATRLCVLRQGEIAFVGSAKDADLRTLHGFLF